MAKQQTVPNNVRVVLEGYIPNQKCPKCKRTFDAGQFVRNEKPGGRALVQTEVCRQCTRTKVDYIAGLFIREFKIDGVPVKVMQHFTAPDGKTVVVRGPARKASQMGLRLMTGSNEVRPQPNNEAGRRAYAASLNGTAKLPLGLQPQPFAKRPHTRKTLLIAALLANGAQATRRTADTAMKGILKAMRATGIISPIAVGEEPDGTQTIVNGHRTAKGASILGETHIEADVYPVQDKAELIKLFNEFDEATRKMVAGDKFQSWAEKRTAAERAAYLKTMRGPAARDIRWLVENVGDNWTAEVGRVPLAAPHVAEQIKIMQTAIRERGLDKASRGWSPVPLIDIADWIVILHQQRYVREQKSLDFATVKGMRAVLKCVREGIPASSGEADRTDMPERVARLAAVRAARKAAA